MDLAAPRDATLADRHFDLECHHDGSRLRDLSGRGAIVNGQPATSAMLRDGDRITAGQTVFALQIESQANGPIGGSSSSSTSAAGGKQDAGQTAVEFPLASEVCEQFQLSAEARPLLKPDLPADQFATQLTAKQLHADAVRCLAYALPRPTVIAWACQAAEQSMDKTSPERDRAALAAARQWLGEPLEEHRREAFKTAQAAEFSSPAALAALAVFWSGGSIAPPDLQEVFPPPHLCAQAASNAIILAAVTKEPRRAAEKFQQFLAMGQRAMQP
jgi:hypothetical protein